jgi:hypothetical protein
MDRSRTTLTVLQPLPSHLARRRTFGYPIILRVSPVRVLGQVERPGTANRCRGQIRVQVTTGKTVKRTMLSSLLPTDTT